MTGEKNKMVGVPKLPDEIVYTEILPRLPVKSALRFQSVSKAWKVEISSDEFVENHSAAQSPNDKDCLIVNKLTSKFSLLRRYEETHVSYPRTVFLRCELIGSFDGLVCIRSGEKFYMWNPALRKSKEFSLPPDLSDGLSDNGLDFSDLTHSGLCFDTDISDYKVIVCFVRHQPNTNITYGTVYSYKEDTWKKVSVVPHDLFRLDYSYGTCTCPCVMIKECPYWKTRPSIDSLDFAAVKFEARIDAFKSLPTFHHDPNTDLAGILYQFVNMKDSLTLIASNMDRTVSPVVDMYCLDNEDESGVWTKSCRIKLPSFFNNRPWSPSQGFQYGDELLFEQTGMYTCYNQNSQKTTSLLGCQFSPALICYPYKPTFRLLSGMKCKHQKATTHCES